VRHTVRINITWAYLIYKSTMQFSIDKKTVVDMLTIGFNTVTVAAKGFHKHVMMHVIAILRTY